MTKPIQSTRQPRDTYVIKGTPHRLIDGHSQNTRTNQDVPIDAALRQLGNYDTRLAIQSARAHEQYQTLAHLVISYHD